MLYQSIIINNVVTMRKSQIPYLLVSKYDHARFQTEAECIHELTFGGSALVDTLIALSMIRLVNSPLHRGRFW